MTFAPLGDSAVVVSLGQSIDESTLKRVRAVSAAVASLGNDGIVDVVPAYTTVTVFYEAAAFGGGDVPVFERVCALLRERIASAGKGGRGLLRRRSKGVAKVFKTVIVPVCYEGEFGPDLEDVARHCRLSPEAVVAQHAAGNYVVHAIGFAPGFTYLGGLAPRLHTPRRRTPRPAVVPGSVGIGWQQTGVYPIATPGGWQLIGRTPLKMFQADRDPPSLLTVGDRVKFRRISAQEFATWK